MNPGKYWEEEPSSSDEDSEVTAKRIKMAMARSFYEQNEAAAAGVQLEGVTRLRAEVSNRMLQELAEASVK